MAKVLILVGNRKAIASFLVIPLILIFWYLSNDRVLKRDREIEGVLFKNYSSEFCVQYALITTEAGNFPCYNCSSGSIYLNPGEVWKYGKTCNGQSGRYPNGFPVPNLKFVIQFEGTESMCLIEEKRKIYSYPALPECLKRNIKLLRPPGNKIDR
ncbi:MAG: hypothetical protein U0W24_00660 [Bacteroidales bacterium]